jgi:TIGR00251 family protein
VSEVAVTATRDGVRFSVRVQPRASANQVAGTYGAALKVRLTAPPVDGAANDALLGFLAGTLGVSRRAVRIVAGESSRSKIVEVDGIGPERIIELAGQQPAKGWNK